MNLPADFSHKILHLLPATEAKALLSSLQETAPSVSVRLNAKKPCACAWEGEEKGEVPWCEGAWYLAERPAFTLDPRLHAGAYYVQEASSMFLAHIYKEVCARYELRPLRALDLCAAPGGKSTLLRSLLPDEALLVCNEPMAARAQVLRENLVKWGGDETVITSAYASDFARLGEVFDWIVADVPCSGEGMFRKDEGAVAQWTLALTEQCAALGREIVTEAWKALREGGVLVYSTCTFNPRENEENVRYFRDTLGAELLEIPVPKAWNIYGDTTGSGLPVHHFFPHRTEGEGFFVCAMRKQEGGKSRSEKKRIKSEKILHAPKEISAWLEQTNAQSVCSYDGGGSFWAISQAHAPFVQQIVRSMPTIAPGVQVAEAAGRKWVPAHALGLSFLLRRDTFPRIELDLPTVLSYLRREAITLPSAAPRGQVLVTHHGLPLGFCNNLGSRANNRYPEQWRIRIRN